MNIDFTLALICSVTFLLGYLLPASLVLVYSGRHTFQYLERDLREAKLAGESMLLAKARGLFWYLVNSLVPGWNLFCAVIIVCLELVNFGGEQLEKLADIKVTDEELNTYADHF